ncbi:hypothetical protein GTCCBUS3UF5_33930 [Geobacillus thermoleovorans CCB_US3_UF5]|uniref:Uncharacterized protein n=2 Tax=Geobacillus TaxID=129337 RepID=A0A1Q5SYA3_9BACL|nr:hypothetical protein GTCCBUS3UF5_33930 [Geobacillus thermoleovorans CCB_US3_UF5]OKO93001.1 hypothetical protein BRO54_2165 [Geobacillus proteiniphilus]
MLSQLILIGSSTRLATGILDATKSFNISLTEKWLIHF